MFHWMFLFISKLLRVFAMHELWVCQMLLLHLLRWSCVCFNNYPVNMVILFTKQTTDIQTVLSSLCISGFSLQNILKIFQVEIFVWFFFFFFFLEKFCLLLIIRFFWLHRMFLPPLCSEGLCMSFILFLFQMVGSIYQWEHLVLEFLCGKVLITYWNTLKELELLKF